MKNNYLISVVGATGIGKTALAIRLAEHFNTEIISSDSRQFFKEMKIGTAVPTSDELSRVKHHFIQNRSIHKDYNVGAFEKDAVNFLRDKFTVFDFFVMVGGSGLYVDAVLNGLDDFPHVDAEFRTKLLADLDEHGMGHLQEQLKKVDPVSYNRIDIQNKQRLIRALEIYQGTGRPFSSFLMNKKNDREFKAIKIGIQADRKIVYDRINQRVDQMMEMGLLEEAERLYPYRELNALQTVGYKEFFDYFDGKISLEFAISEIKKNTRRFAKRQGTWFKRDKDIQWFDYQVDDSLIIDHITNFIQQK